MTMNIELLREVQRGILKEPKRYNQGIWTKYNDANHCNTAGCIAGWASAIDLGLLNDADKLKSVYAMKEKSVTALAQEALNLTFGEKSKLFYAEDWPIVFWPFTAFGSGSLHGPKWLQAIVAAIRIEVFIRSKGRL